MSTGFADINGARLYYEVAGEGPALVLLHAGICDSRMWDDQFAVFAEHYRTVRYDLRGYGQSNPVAGRFAHYEDLRALLDHLGIERAYLMGVSFGGMIAIDFTLTYPQRVAGLILVGSGVGGYYNPAIAEPAEAEEAQQAFEAGDFERAAELEVRVWVDGPQRQPEQVNAAIRDKVRAMNLIALRNLASRVGEAQRLDPPAAKRLNELRAPLLLIIGDLDQPEISDIGDFLTGQVPAAQTIVMSGTAHLPNMEQPSQFNGHVLDWLGAQAG